MVERPNEPGQDAIDTVNLSRIRKAQDESNSSSASLAGICAAAQLQNLHLPAAKKALKIAKGDASDVEKYLDETEKVFAYLRMLGIRPERQQLDMFRSVEAPAPEDELARNAGRVAGLLGDGESANPHAANTPKGMAWLEGCRAGASERQTVLSMPAPHPADEDDDDLENEA